MRQRVEFEGTLVREGSFMCRTPSAANVVDTREESARAPDPRTLDNRLRSLGIDDEEIDRIAALQAAPPEQVVRCLLSEGSCAAPSRREGRR